MGNEVETGERIHMMLKDTHTEKSSNEVQDFAENVIDNVEKVIVGKRSIIELVLIAFLCEGHVLIEDAPGTGKTKFIVEVPVFQS